MNRVYQVVWSDEVGAWVVVSELASRRRRSASARKAPPRPFRRWMLATALCLGPFAGAQAQSIFWDGNDTTANADGGNGTWQNGGTNWDSLATGGANTAWNSAIPNDAVFGGAAGTVTIAAGGVTAHNLTFNITGYTVSGGTLTLGGGTPTISTATSSIISSVIAGTSGVSKTGAGVLHVEGAVPSAFATVNVQGGTLHVAAPAMLTSVAQLTVAQGARLQVDGTISGTSGRDLMDVGGNVEGSGLIDLGAGDDRLLLHDTAQTQSLTQAIDGGDGIDTIDAQVDSGAQVLGPTVHFESLAKQGAGELRISRDETFDDTEILGGTLAIDAGHALASRHTLLAAGSTLRIDGAFTGTTGDDTFDSAGTIRGSLAFGTGNDAVTFHGGDLSALTEFEGGTGNDTVTFDAMQIDGASLTSMQSFERMDLQSGSTLALAQTLPLSGGVLSIDATSTLRSVQGAQIAGSLENAGTVRIDGGRLAIAGDYTGSGEATLQLVVSPSTGTAGGMDIAGDVRGTTRIAFETDGSVVTQPTRIKVIDSPHDVAGEGTFVATRSGEGFVRLPGSVLNWGFAQDPTDKDWYLRTEAFGEQQLGLLPEVPGYGILPTTTMLSARSAGQRAFDHLGSMRDQVDRCGHKDDKPVQGQRQFDDCNGAWASVSAEEVDVGANPGAAFNGDNLAMFMGVDLIGRDAGADAFNGGVFVGLQRGGYWTNGANSSPIAAVAASNVRTETHVFGAYGSRDWQSGWHLDATAIGQLNEGTVKASDGFSQDVVGESFGARARVRARIGLALRSAVHARRDRLHWRDVVDGSGKVLQLGDDVIGTARAELRAERDFDTTVGTHWQPWVVAGLEDTFGENAEAMTVLQHDGTAQHFPNHASGLAATLDLGIELKTSAKLSWFGSVAWGHALDGTYIDRAHATLGARLQW